MCNEIIMEIQKAFLSGKKKGEKKHSCVNE